MSSALNLPPLPTTGIGSLPFRDAHQAAKFVLDAGLTIPFWPQLPKRDPIEGMVPQYSENMPCVRIDAEAGTVAWDEEGKFAELERFYQDYLSEDPAPFAMSESRAQGLYAFLSEAAGRSWPVVKGHATGPLTYANTVADADKRPLYADADLRDAAVKLLSRKAQWQIRQLQPFASDKVLIFFDEPVLAAYGSSAYLNIMEEHVREMLGEVFQAVADAGGAAGVHVCGNSDWGMVARTGATVVNFDAYQYGPTMALYPEDVQALFDRGGYVAWGIVPTSNDVRQETADSLAKRFEACVKALADKGVDADLARDRAILTPSCGAGSLGEDDARRVFALLKGLREALLGA